MRSKRGVLLLCWTLLSVQRIFAQENSPKPEERVRDESGLISAATRFLLEDYLDSVAKIHKFQAYVVVLQHESFEESARLSDRWQKEWIKESDGGVFVYCAKERKFCYTPTDETMALVGRIKLMGLFQDLEEREPTSNNDIAVALPVQRIVSAVEAAKLNANRLKVEEAEAGTKAAELQADRWKIVAGLGAIAAVVGFGGCFFMGFSSLLRREKSGRSGMPTSGVTSRNSPDRDRRRRRRRDSEPEEKEDRKDRF